MVKEEDISQENEVLKIEEAAAFLGVATHTLYSAAQQKRIPAQKVGKRWMFSREALEQHFGKQAATPQRLHPDDVELIACAVMEKFRTAFGGR